MDIILIRHTSVDAAGLCYGRTDVPLAATFEEEAEAVVAKVSAVIDLAEARIYSSPLTRSRRLAEYLCRHDKQRNNIHFNDALMEMDFGSWEGKKWKKIARNDSKRLMKWMASYVRQPAPKGESFRDVYERSVAAFEAIASDDSHPDAPRVIVAHAGVVRSMIAHALGVKLRRAALLGIDYGGVSHLKVNESGITVAFINR
jgi:alpha-ribazole phosphatase